MYECMHVYSYPVSSDVVLYVCIGVCSYHGFSYVLFGIDDVHVYACVLLCVIDGCMQLCVY